MILENILIEINDKHLNRGSDRIPVVLNFEFHKIVGKAIVKEQNDGLYADILLSDELLDKYGVKDIVKLLYPAIGHDTHKVWVISLCGNENQDSRILRIGKQMTGG